MKVLIKSITEEFAPCKFLDSHRLFGNRKVGKDMVVELSCYSCTIGTYPTSFICDSGFSADFLHICKKIIADDIGVIVFNNTEISVRLVEKSEHHVYCDSFKEAFFRAMAEDADWTEC